MVDQFVPTVFSSQLVEGVLRRPSGSAAANMFLAALSPGQKLPTMGSR